MSTLRRITRSAARFIASAGLGVGAVALFLLVAPSVPGLEQLGLRVAELRDPPNPRQEERIALLDEQVAMWSTTKGQPQQEIASTTTATAARSDIDRSAEIRAQREHDRAVITEVVTAAQRAAQREVRGGGHARAREDATTAKTEEFLQAYAAAEGNLARYKLARVPLTYSRPSYLVLGRSSEVAAILASANFQAAQKDVARYQGDHRTAEVAIGNHVTAELTGAPDQVAITARSPSDRDLSRIVNSKWVWDVRPLQPGVTTLTLMLRTEVREKGKKSIEFEVFRDQFAVRMQLADAINFYAAKYQPTLSILGITSLAGAIVGIWQFIKWLRGRPNQTP